MASWKDRSIPVDTAPADAPAAPIGAPPPAGGDWKSRSINATPPAASSTDIKQTHPDFTAADRLITKNFSSDNASAIDYLQRQHPDLDVKEDPASGRIVARKKDGSEATYKALDPQTGVLGTLMDPKELALTVGGAGYDIGSGLASTAASAAAGLGAGAATGGIGALPAAMAAGGATNAGFEGLREALGKHLFGMNQEDLQAGPMAAAAAGGAVSPLLFGTGASAANVATKAAESGVAPEVLAAAQRGLPSRLLPKIGSLTSGVPAASISNFAKDPAAIAALSQGSQPITDFTEGVVNDAGTKLRDAKQGAWGALKTELGGAGDAKVVNLAPVAQPLEDAIAEKQALYNASPTKTNESTLDMLKKKLTDLFTETTKVEQPGAPVATGILDASGNPIMTAGEKVTQSIPSRKAITTPIDAIEMGKRLNEDALFTGMDPNFGGVGNRFGPNATADEKYMATIAAQMKGQLEGELGKVLSPEAMAAKANYGKIAGDETLLKNLTSTPEDTFKNLRNANNMPNVTKLEAMNRLDNTYGTTLMDAAQKLDAYKYLGKPSPLAVSTGGASGLSRTAPLAASGAAAGAYLGNKEGGAPGAFAGGLAGAGAGSMLGGPAAIKNLILAAAKAKNIIPAAARNAIPDQPITQAGINSVWNMMQGGPQ